MPRTLTIDVETAPLKGYFWQIRDENIGLNQIEEDWCLLSYSAKWLGHKEMIYSDTGGRGKSKVRDDKRITREIHALLDEADIVVAQNGKRFDVKKVNTRMLMHRIPPYSPIRVVDTYQVAKSKFGFASNKLEWLSGQLTDTPKDDHREFPGFYLWLECLKDNPKAWKQMKVYNPRDVVATEAVYLEMLPWITDHPNAGVYIEDDEPRCTRCGSDKLQRRGYGYTQLGSYAKYQCQGCKGWTRGRKNQLPTEVRKNLMVSV